MQNNEAGHNWRRENLFIREVTISMNHTSDYLIDSIFKKLQNYKAKEVFLEKENFKKFIFSLFKEN